MPSPSAGIGSIAGVVLLEGPITELPPLEATKDRMQDGGPCHDRIPDPSLLVDPATRGVRNAVVHIVDMPAGRGRPLPGGLATDLAIDQKACMYEPHVAILARGGTLRVSNGDPVHHNVNIRGWFNEMQYEGNGPLERTASEPGFFRGTCTMHGWMACYVVVAEHPYYALTDASGRFEIRDVPPGEYVLRVWHEYLGDGEVASERNVTVRAGEPGPQDRVVFRVRAE